MQVLRARAAVAGPQQQAALPATASRCQWRHEPSWPPRPGEPHRPLSAHRQQRRRQCCLPCQRRPARLLPRQPQPRRQGGRHRRQVRGRHQAPPVPEGRCWSQIGQVPRPWLAPAAPPETERPRALGLGPPGHQNLTVPRQPPPARQLAPVRQSRQPHPQGYSSCCLQRPMQLLSGADSAQGGRQRAGSDKLPPAQVQFARPSLGPSCRGGPGAPALLRVYQDICEALGPIPFGEPMVRARGSGRAFRSGSPTPALSACLPKCAGTLLCMAGSPKPADRQPAKQRHPSLASR